MPDEAIAAAHEQAVEQVMSDERLLGVLPDDLSTTLLDWVNAQIGQAAERAPTVDAFWEGVDAIRLQARKLADASADAGDDAPALIVRLRSAEAVAGEAPSKPVDVERKVPSVPAPPAVDQPRGKPPAASDRSAVDEAPGPVPAPARPPVPNVPGPAGEPVAPAREPAPTPKRPQRPITKSIRSSFRRTYRRFRALFR